MGTAKVSTLAATSVSGTAAAATTAKASTLAATAGGTAVAVTTTAKAGTLAGTTAATGGVTCALVPLCVAAGSCAASMALLSHLPSKQKKRNPAWNQRRMQHRKLSMAWEKWQFEAAEMKRQEMMLRRGIMRLFMKQLATGF